MRRGMVAIALSWALAPAGLMGQDARLSERLDRETAGVVAAEVAAAAEQDLPTEPLVQKALEGQSKGAPPDRIIWAVRHLRADLASAARALGPDAGDADLVAAAGAVAVGVDDETLRQVAGAVGPESLTLSLVVLADLVRRGVAPDPASEAVRRVAGARGNADDLQRFWKQVLDDILIGVAPGAAVTRRAGGFLVGPGSPPRTPEGTVS